MPKLPETSVAAMRTLCDDVNMAIVRGDLPAETMVDLKRIVDEARLRLWASMESAKSGDPAWTQEFWLQRAADMCLAAIEQLETGTLDRESAQASGLREVAEKLATTLRAGRG